MTLVRSEHLRMVDMVSQLAWGDWRAMCVGHINPCIVQYLSIITQVSQGCTISKILSLLSLLYTLGATVQLYLMQCMQVSTNETSRSHYYVLCLFTAQWTLQRQNFLHVRIDIPSTRCTIRNTLHAHQSSCGTIIIYMICTCSGREGHCFNDLRSFMCSHSQSSQIRHRCIATCT